MDAQTQLLQDLQRVFPSVVVEARACPHVCPECDEISATLAQRNWMDVPSPFIAANCDVLPLLSDEAYAAYLPAWLRQGLLNPDEGVADMLFINLSDSPNTSRFTSEQGQVIADIAIAMNHVSMWSDDPAQLEHVEKIKRLWTQHAV